MSLQAAWATGHKEVLICLDVIDSFSQADVQVTGSQGKSDQTLEVKTPKSLGQETEKVKDKGHKMQQEAVKLTGKQSEKQNRWVTYLSIWNYTCKK